MILRADCDPCPSAGVLVTAVFTLITPLAANSGSIYFLYTVQFIRTEGG